MFSYFKMTLKDHDFIKAALIIAVPLMLQQLVVSSVNLVDNLMVGQLGDVALSGVANANRFYMIAWSGINGMVASGVIYLSQFNGANDEKRMKATFRFMLVSSFLISLVFVVLALSFANNIIGFFIGEEIVILRGASYLKVACLSYIPGALSLCISGAFRTLGETKLPLKISIVSVLTNTCLNYCLIFGNFGFPYLAEVGAAIATLIARVVELSLNLLSLHRSSFAFKTRLKEIFHFSFKLAKEIVIKAIPLCINDILYSLGISTLLKAYSNRGLVANTAYSMSSTISDLFFVLFTGMSTATTVLVGTALGANDLKKAKDNGYKMVCFGLMCAMVFLVLMFGCSFIAPYLYNVSLEAKHLAAAFLRVMSIFFVMYVFNSSIYFVLRAGGDTKSTLFMDSCFMWACNIPVVAGLSYLTDLGVIVLYICGQMTDVLKAGLSYYLLRREKWVKNLTSQEV